MNHNYDQFNESKQSLHEETVISLLNEMIFLKKENIFLKKEINFLTTILKSDQLNNPLSHYIGSSFISDLNTLQNNLKEYLPNDKLETIYLIDGNKGGKRKRKIRPKMTKI